MPWPHDGRVYFWRSGRIFSVAAEGGDERQVLEGPIGFAAWQVWADKLVYALVTGAGGGAIEIVDLRTNQPREHATLTLDPIVAAYFGGKFFGLTVSPDGQFILFSRLDVAGSDLVLVENYR